MLSILDSVNQHAVSILHSVLSDTLFLASKNKMFHWNVIGPHFIELHKFFEEQYQSLSEAADEIAERIRALDHFVEHTVNHPLSKLEALQSGKALSEKEMLQDLLSEHTKIIESLKKSIEQLNEKNHFATADLLTDRLYQHEKTVWILKSLLV